MPLHVYQCPDCKVEFDELRDFHADDIDHATCSRCGCLHCEKVYRSDAMGNFDKEAAAPEQYDEQLGLVVADGAAFTIEQRRGQEVVAAYDMRTGGEPWTNVTNYGNVDWDPVRPSGPLPAADIVHLRPNQYEPSRANLSLLQPARTA